MRTGRTDKGGPENGPPPGSNAQGQTLPQLQAARCRLLEPAGIDVNTPAELRRCRDEQTGWVNREYGINPKFRGFRNFRGFRGIQARVYVETACATSPPETEER